MLSHNKCTNMDIPNSSCKNTVMVDNPNSLIENTTMVDLSNSSYKTITNVHTWMSQAVYVKPLQMYRHGYPKHFM